MKTTHDGRRRFSREFKIAAVRRVLEGEELGAVARELNIAFRLLWDWKKRVVERGEEHLHGIGRPSGSPTTTHRDKQAQRMAELERLVGRQQLEIRFLDKALRRVGELRQQKNDDGGAASSKR
jgi:transposase-like protein